MRRPGHEHGLRERHLEGDALAYPQRAIMGAVDDAGHDGRHRVGPDRGRDLRQRVGVSVRGEEAGCGRTLGENLRRDGSGEVRRVGELRVQSRTRLRRGEGRLRREPGFGRDPREERHALEIGRRASRTDVGCEKSRDRPGRGGDVARPLRTRDARPEEDQHIRDRRLDQECGPPIGVAGGCRLDRIGVEEIEPGRDAERGRDPGGRVRHVLSSEAFGERGQRRNDRRSIRGG